MPPGLVKGVGARPGFATTLKKVGSAGKTWLGWQLGPSAKRQAANDQADLPRCLNQSRRQQRNKAEKSTANLEHKGSDL